MTFTTRFAPSPTGPLHLGHAYSALLAHDMARAAQGRFHLRLDDIDQSRARPHWAEGIKTDMAWLGVEWDGPVWQQSDRLPHYRAALESLWAIGLLYPCTCTRRDIMEAANAPQEGGKTGPDGLVYPGTCRPEAPPTGVMPEGPSLRLNMKYALQAIDYPIEYQETGEEPKGARRVDPAQMLRAVGDVVLARRGMGASYHLAIVVDDAEQNITHVIRGRDLSDATAIHVVLQRLFGFSSPLYHHHRLIRDTNGKRLAKRDDARAIARYRDDGLTPQAIRRELGLASTPRALPG